MAKKKTFRRARQVEREGKAPFTQAGEFVREEIEHIRRGLHGARSPKQAIAIGLSKARKAGIMIPAGGKSASRGKRRKIASARAKAHLRRRPSAKRSRAITGVLKRESRAAALPGALSRQARRAARRRSPQLRRAAAQRALRTKARAVRQRAARKAARVRARRRVA